MKFPKPWLMEQTDHDGFCVSDANGRKLFYIMGDEGDDQEAEPSALFYSDDDADTDTLVGEISKILK
jgi:hypothetical protein